MTPEAELSHLQGLKSGPKGHESLSLFMVDQSQPPYHTDNLSPCSQTEWFPLGAESVTSNSKEACFLLIQTWKEPHGLTLVL